MWFPFRRIHGILGSILIICSAISAFNQKLELIPQAYDVLLLVAIGVIQIVFLLRLSAYYGSLRPTILFYSLFASLEFIHLLYFPSQFGQNRDNTFTEAILLWAFFGAFNALTCIMVYFIRYSKSLRHRIYYKQALYDKVIEALPIGIAVHKRDKTIPIMNKQTRKDAQLPHSAAYYAQEQRDASTASPREAILDNFIASLWDNLDETQETNEEDIRDTIFWQRHGGAHAWTLYDIGYSLLKLPLPNFYDTPKLEHDHLLAFAVDVSEREQLIQQLTKAKEKAESANQAKSTFLANVSHELRTPLTSIVGFSQLIRTQDINPTVHDLADIITRSGENLLALVNDILDLSKAENNSLELYQHTVELRTMLDEEIQSLSSQAEDKGLRLSTAYHKTLPDSLSLDEGKVRQILRNLLSNALKFTDKGSVHLSVWSSNISDPMLLADKQHWHGESIATHPLHAQLMEKHATILKEQQDNSDPDALIVFFEVGDTGAGIAAEELVTIFEPFTQSRSGLASQQGTGLGLNISKKYAQFLAGDLYILSEVHKGTLCLFYIVAQPEQA